MIKAIAKAASGNFLSVAIELTARDCQLEIIRVDGTSIQFHGAVDVGYIKNLLE